MDFPAWGVYSAGGPALKERPNRREARDRCWRGFTRSPRRLLFERAYIGYDVGDILG
jgi:hypothetical protein